MRICSLLVLAALPLTACAAQTGSSPPPAAASGTTPKSLYELMGIEAPGLRGVALDAAVRAARGVPLGSEKNPVRTRGIAGQRAYLSRLRCGDGRAPAVRGRGMGPPSPFGGVGDIYGVACPGAAPATASIHMDMYHDHVEARPVAPFTIVAP